MPIISLTRNPVAVAISSRPVNYSFPLTIYSNCSRSSDASTCSMTLSDYRISSFQFPVFEIKPNQAVGRSSANITCISKSSNLTATLMFDFWVVNPSFLEFKQNYVPRVADCKPFRLPSDMLSITFDGGMTDAMIKIDTSPNDEGEQILSRSSIGNRFTLESINNESVYFLPNILQKVGSSKNVSIPMSIVDVGGRLIRAAVSFTVDYTFCPLENKIPAIFSNGTAVIIPTLGISEAHNLSIWDLELVPSLEHGFLEFYCPDPLCGGPKWVNLMNDVGKFKYGWVHTNSIRWNPNGYSGVHFWGNFTSVLEFGGDKLHFKLEFGISDSEPLFEGLPLTQADSCTSYSITETGLRKTNSLQFGTFQTNSPERPICATFNVFGVKKWGSMTFSSPRLCQVQISAWVSGPSNTLLEGFEPLTFVGNNGDNGTIFNAVKIDLNCDGLNTPLTVKMPQARYPISPIPTTKEQIAILKYNEANGQVIYRAADAWSIDSEPGLVIEFSIQSSGIYIFGQLNKEKLQFPIASNEYIYVAKNTPNTYKLNEDELEIELKSGNDCQFALMRSRGVTPSFIKYKVLYTIYLNVKEEAKTQVTFTLRKRISNANAVWA